MPASRAAASIAAPAGWPGSSPSRRVLTILVTPGARKAATSSASIWPETSTLPPSGRAMSALQRGERGKGMGFLFGRARPAPPLAAAPDPAGDLPIGLESDLAHQLRHRRRLQAERGDQVRIH